VEQRSGSVSDSGQPLIQNAVRAVGLPPGDAGHRATITQSAASRLLLPGAASLTLGRGGRVQ
jgi:hypothetical protein